MANLGYKVAGVDIGSRFVQVSDLATLPLPVPVPPATTGTFWMEQGGYYAGKIYNPDDLKTYAIIVSPKASGQSTSKLWATSPQPIGTTGSLYDGWKNTNQNNNSTYPAFKWARSLTINGFSDWYVPSRDELEICYRNLKPTTNPNNVYASRATLWGGVPAGTYNGVDNQGNGDNDYSVPNGAAYTASNPAQTSIAVFQSGGSECFDSNWYFSSTWFTSNNAWLQHFINGTQGYYAQTNSCYVRCVRRVAI